MPRKYYSNGWYAVVGPGGGDAVWVSDRFPLTGKLTRFEANADVGIGDDILIASNPLFLANNNEDWLRLNAHLVNPTAQRFAAAFKERVIWRCHNPLGVFINHIIKLWYDCFIHWV